MRTIARTSRRAFTLIELLVVIGILLILVTLSIGVGALVTQGGEQRLTQNVLSTLDRALDEYIGVVGAVPAYVPERYIGVPGPEVTLDGPYQGSLHPRRPDAAVFIADGEGVGVVGDIIANLPARFLVATPTNAPAGGPGSITDVTPEAPSIVDPWGDEGWGAPWDPAEQQLIYYVHPENALAQDLYGSCKNGRPYFLSAGPDTLYGLNDDPFIPDAPDGGSGAPGEHTYETVLEAQRDNLTSYEVEPLSRAAFERTQSEGVR